MITLKKVLFSHRPGIAIYVSNALIFYYAFSLPKTFCSVIKYEFNLEKELNRKELWMLRG